MSFIIDLRKEVFLNTCSSLWGGQPINHRSRREFCCVGPIICKLFIWSLVQLLNSYKILLKNLFQMKWFETHSQLFEWVMKLPSLVLVVLIIILECEISFGFFHQRTNLLWLEIEVFVGTWQRLRLQILHWCLT